MILYAPGAFATLLLRLTGSGVQDSKARLHWEKTYIIYENGRYKIFANRKLEGRRSKKYADLLEKSGFEIRG